MMVMMMRNVDLVVFFSFRINMFEGVGSFEMLKGNGCWYKASPVCCEFGEVVDFADGR